MVTKVNAPERLWASFTMQRDKAAHNVYAKSLAKELVRIIKLNKLL